MSSPEITLLLSKLSRGQREALDELLPLVYEQLREMARRRLAGRSGLTLTTTALVHETYLKLFDKTAWSWNDRQHFFAVAARAMRQIVIDQARRRNAQKRGGGDWKQVDIDPAILEGGMEALDALALDTALTRLESLDGRLSQVVELRVFAGLSVEETAEVLDVAPRTVKRDWRKARAFLYDAMEGGA